MRFLTIITRSIDCRVSLHRKLALALTFLPIAAAAQQNVLPAYCGTAKDWAGRVYFCSAEHLSVPSEGELKIDGGENGSVEIRNSEDQLVHIVAVKTAWLPATDAGNAVLSKVLIHLAGPQLSSRFDGSIPALIWGVNFKVAVPKDMRVDVSTVNGSVDISGTLRRVSIHSVNGAINLSEVKDVNSEPSRLEPVTTVQPAVQFIQAHTENGSIQIVLPPIEQYGLIARTTLGKITLTPLPPKQLLEEGKTAVIGADFAVQAQISTANGNVHIVNSSW